MEHKIKIPEELSFTRGQVVAALVLFAVCVSPKLTGAETYTLEAYYPSPAGVYANMTVLSQTVLARDSGNVGIGTAEPASRLQVAGGVQLGDDDAACVAAKAGTQRWHGGGIQVCDGTSWKTAGGSLPGTWCGYGATGMTQAINTILCGGADPAVSCPAGYTRTNTGYGWEAHGNPVIWYYTCVAN